ncbi:efflux RND transporter periplasmic adaptor subunit [Parvularcula flava]|uniref:Efflux RND transporter periplasmic adaptor subunit n=1 Tax=Aquisalinus luteolus TaxID=1566827 RepID=A0A8J3A2B1_9PROT|nr:efflux RND transporter periplasmic adaptor subunit [Aquisalinus luteolus]NHK26834.1 efflux RND transporter periplasmic adaptor subunit [Aquisalinus luteolus]GGH93553.1 MexX family efflux pump subunit [Aquisalinus luteolus]
MPARYALPVKGSFKSGLAATLSLAMLGVVMTGCSDQQSQAQEAPPGQQATQVKTITLDDASVELAETLSGRASAYRIAEIRPQVTGLIEERIFIEGGEVAAGDPLYRIEDTEYRAAVDSAAAALARAQATAEVTRQQAARFERLVENNAVSQQQYDEAVAAARQAEADVGMQQAALKTARTNLERSVIRAPIDGQIGRSAVTEGALVTQNQAQALATIRQLDPVYVDLTASSADLLSWRRQMAEGRMASTGEGNVPVTITLEDGTVYDRQGELEFTEVSIDERAGTVVIRATVPNPDNYILPGSFVRASLPVGEYENAILAPQAAVQRTPKGEAFAYVVSPEGTAEQRMLTVETARSGDWIVTSGLSEGEELIVSGLMMLRPGVPVAVVNDAGPQGAGQQGSGPAGAGTNAAN